MGLYLHEELFNNGEKAVIEQMIKTTQQLNWKRSDRQMFVNVHDLILYIESEKLKTYMRPTRYSILAVLGCNRGAF